MAGESIPHGELTVTALNGGISLKTFDCEDSDLNDFLKNDAFSYEEKGIVRTYVCLYQNSPIGFFSICTDAIRLSKEERETEFGKPKPHVDYPALKIARLAVAREYKLRSVGRFMVELAIGKAIDVSKEVGCRFVTVDAYPGIAAFYEKCGFIRNEGDGSGPNVSMRLDLIDALK